MKRGISRTGSRWWRAPPVGIGDPPGGLASSSQYRTATLGEVSPPRNPELDRPRLADDVAGTTVIASPCGPCPCRARRTAWGRAEVQGPRRAAVDAAAGEVDHELDLHALLLESEPSCRFFCSSSRELVRGHSTAGHGPAARPATKSVRRLHWRHRVEPCRGWPRYSSRVGTLPGRPGWVIAGSCVRVGPPLLASGPSCGSSPRMLGDGGVARSLDQAG